MVISVTEFLLLFYVYDFLWAKLHTGVLCLFTCSLIFSTKRFVLVFLPINTASLSFLFEILQMILFTYDCSAWLLFLVVTSPLTSSISSFISFHSYTALFFSQYIQTRGNKDMGFKVPLYFYGVYIYTQIARCFSSSFFLFLACIFLLFGINSVQEYRLEKHAHKGNMKRKGVLFLYLYFQRRIRGFIFRFVASSILHLYLVLWWFSRAL